MNHETFEIGKATCPALEDKLNGTFIQLHRAEQAPANSRLQLILLPEFVDMHATQAMLAVADRKLNASIHWTAKNAEAETVWSETIDASGKRMQGNAFNHSIQMKRIVKDVAQELAYESAAKISESQALRQLAEAVCKSKAQGINQNP